MTRVQTAVALARCGGAGLMFATVAISFAVGASAKDRPQAASAADGPASLATPAARKPTPKAVPFKVVVTGEGKPVNNAEVILKPATGGELKQFTNGDGEANFAALPGAAKVRVIATGWVSKRDDVTVAEGKATAKIALEPQR